MLLVILNLINNKLGVVCIIYTKRFVVIIFTGLEEDI